MREQVGALWRQAVDQLDDVRQVVRKRGFEPDVAWLKAERDRLLALLGEQTYKLANQGLVPLPAFVKRTVDRLNDILTTLAPAVESGSDYTSDHMNDVEDSTSGLNGSGLNGTNHAASASADGVKKKPAAKKTRATKGTSKKARASKTTN